MALLSSKTGLPSFSQSLTEINYFPDGGFERGVNGVIPAGWSQFFESDAVTFTDAGDLVAVPSVLPNAGDTVSFTVITGTTGISINTLYYVINPSALSFQLSLTLGGSAIALTTNGTGTMVRGKPKTGSGGVAVPQVTMLVSNSSPIRGTLSAIISKDANNRQGIGFSFPFTISEVDKGLTAGVTIDIDTDTSYAAGDVVFYIYDVTNSVLITPRNVPIPKADNYGKFGSDYGLTTGTQYRFILHIATPNAFAYTLKLDTMVNTTTRTAVPGIVISNDISSTPTTALTATTMSARYQRVVNKAKFHVQFAITGLPAAGNFILTFAQLLAGTGLTVDTTMAASAVSLSEGVWHGSDAGIQNYGGTAVLLPTQLVLLDESGTGVLTTTSVWPMNVGDYVTVDIDVPIAEWAGSSANFGQATALEFAADDGTSDVFGPNGAPVPTIVLGTGVTTRSFPFQSAGQQTDMFEVEIQVQGFSTSVWIPSNSRFPLIRSAVNDFYGIGLEAAVGGIYNVFFGNRGAEANAGFGVNGQAWTAVSRYRLRKCNPLTPVGTTLADAQGNPGNVNPYIEGSGVVYSGKYTPIFTTAANVSAATNRQFNYTRNGKIVTVTGSCNITITAAVPTISAFEFTLPIASELTTNDQAIGTAVISGASGTPYGAGSVSSNSATNRAIVDWNANSSGARVCYVSFSYELL